MVLVFIRHNPDGVINLFLIGKPVGFFQIKKQILHVRIVQGGAFPVKTDGLYDVLAVGQDVVCDSPGKQRVTLEYGQACLLYTSFPTQVSLFFPAFLAGADRKRSVL